MSQISGSITAIKTLNISWCENSLDDLEPTQIMEQVQQLCPDLEKLEVSDLPGGFYFVSEDVEDSPRLFSILMSHFAKKKDVCCQVLKNGEYNAMWSLKGEGGGPLGSNHGK